MTHGLDTSFLVAVEVACHADHAAARLVAGKLRRNGDRLALAPQVLSEFVHIVGDPRRFTAPLTMGQALERATAWWEADDVERVSPSEPSVTWFLSAMKKHQLGRKRVLDTLLAGTYRSVGVTSLLTLNAADFAVFGEFSCVPIGVSAGS